METDFKMRAWWLVLVVAYRAASRINRMLGGSDWFWHNVWYPVADAAERMDDEVAINSGLEELPARLDSVRFVIGGTAGVLWRGEGWYGTDNWGDFRFLSTDDLCTAPQARWCRTRRKMAEWLKEWARL